MRDVGIGTDKGVLCQVVAQRLVAQREVEQEPAHGRLVFPYQLVEGPSVVEYRHLCYEGYIA